MKTILNPLPIYLHCVEINLHLPRILEPTTMKFTLLTTLFTLFSMHLMASSQSAEFRFLSIEIEEGSILTFKTVNEDADLTYYIEQYVYNEWKVIEEVTPLGKQDTCFYAVSIDENLYSGENEFRVAREAVNYVAVYSDEVGITSTLKRVFHFKKGNAVTLSKRIDWFVKDEIGFNVLQGYGSVIDLGDLSKGTYYVCFDNQVAEFKR